MTARADLEAAFRDGGTVHLADGETTGKFVLAAGAEVHVVGAGREETRILGTITAKDGGKLKLEGLSIEDPGAVVIDARGLELELADCALATGIPRESGDEVQHALIDLEGGSVRVEGCSLDGGTQCIDAFDGARVELVDCELGNGWPTLYVRKGSTGDIRNCRLTGGGGAAAMVAVDATARFEDCELRGGFRDQCVVYVQEEASAEFLRCDLRDCDGAALAVAKKGRVRAVESSFVDTERTKKRGGEDVWAWDDSDVDLVDCRIGKTRSGKLKGVLTATKATTLLHKGIAKGCVHTIRVALAAHADVTQATKDGTPVLVGMLRAKEKTGLSARWIIERVLPHVDVNASDADGVTAAFFDLSEPLPEVLDGAGLRRDVVDARGAPPLFHIAGHSGGHGRVEEALQRGVSASQSDRLGRSFLHYAAAGGNQWSCEYLVEGGARVDLRDDEGQLPLDVATRDARKWLKRVHARLEKQREKAGPPVALKDALRQLAGRASRAAPTVTKAPFEVPEHLSEWWSAVADKETLGADDAPIQLWGGGRIHETLAVAPEVDLPVVPVGDDGHGRWVWLITEPVPGRQAPTVVAFPDQLQGLDLATVLDELAAFELSDWARLSALKRRKMAVEAAVGRDPLLAQRAVQRGALEPCVTWHPDQGVRSRSNMSYPERYRRALRLLGRTLGASGVPPGRRLDRAALARRFGLDGPRSFDEELYVHLCATAGLAELAGPLRLVCGGADPGEWSVEGSWMRIGGETFGHEAWKELEYCNCFVAHHDTIAELGGIDHDVALQYDTSVYELLALEARLAPLMGSMGLGADPEQVLVAIAGALNLEGDLKQLVWRVENSGALSFLYNEVSEILHDDEALSRVATALTAT